MGGPWFAYVLHSDSSLLVRRWLWKWHITTRWSMRHAGKSLGDRTVKVLALQKRPEGETVPFLPLTFCVRGIMLLGFDAILHLRGD